MKFLFIFLILPIVSIAQFNKAFVAKTNLNYARLEYCGEGLFGFEKDGKVGYMDANEKIVIPATFDLKLGSYEYIPYFYNGYAAIKLKGKYGLIDKTGKIILPYEYSYISTNNIQKNYVKVGKEINYKVLYGIVNSQNNVIIPLQYDELNVDNNLVVVSLNKKFGILDITGKELVPLEYNSIFTSAKDKIAIVGKDLKVGAIDLKGNWLFEKVKSVYTLLSSKEGLIKCMVSGRYGFLDLKGNEVITTKYITAEDFMPNGLARVSKTSPESKYKNIYGYINKKGDEVIAIKYEWLSKFSNELAPAKDPETNRYGFLNKMGNWAIKPSYLSEPSAFDKFGGSWVKMTDDNYHYINNLGKDFGTLDSTGKLTAVFSDGYNVNANKNYSYALIDDKGNVIKILDDCDGIYTFSEGIAGYKSKIKGLYGFVDLNGNKITNGEFSSFSGFSEGIAYVGKLVNGKTKYGFVNDKGKTIIPFEYDQASNFSNGWAVVKKDNEYHFIDKNGNLKEPSRKFDNLTEFKSGFSVGTINGTNRKNIYYYINPDLKEVFNIEAKAAYLFWEDIAIINRDSIYEMINKKGESVKLLTDYDQLRFCTEGKLAVRKDKKWGFINTKGDLVIPLKYDSCDSYKNGYVKVMMNGKWGIIDKLGNQVIEPIYKNLGIGDGDNFIQLDTNWGIINKSGKIIAENKFYNITTFVKNRALARLGAIYTILKSPLIK